MTTEIQHLEVLYPSCAYSQRLEHCSRQNGQYELNLVSLYVWSCDYEESCCLLCKSHGTNDIILAREHTRAIWRCLVITDTVQ